MFDDDDMLEEQEVAAYNVLRTAGFDSFTAKKITLHYLLTRAAVADLPDLQEAALECGYSFPGGPSMPRES